MMLKIEKGIHLVVAVLFHWLMLMFAFSLFDMWDLNGFLAFFLVFVISSFLWRWQRGRYHKIYDGVTTE